MTVDLGGVAATIDEGADLSFTGSLRRWQSVAESLDGIYQYRFPNLHGSYTHMVVGVKRFGIRLGSAYLGIARCREGDVYDQRLGFEIAAGRAMTKAKHDEFSFTFPFWYAVDDQRMLEQIGRRLKEPYQKLMEQELKQQRKRAWLSDWEAQRGDWLVGSLSPASFAGPLSVGSADRRHLTLGHLRTMKRLSEDGCHVSPDLVNDVADELIGRREVEEAVVHAMLHGGPSVG